MGPRVRGDDSCDDCLTASSSALDGAGRRSADRRSASGARNRAGCSAPCRRRRRILGSRDRRPASDRWPRSIPAATAAGSSAPHCHMQSDRVRVRPRKHAPAPCCRAKPAETPASCAAQDAPCAGGVLRKRGSWRGRTGRAGALCRLPHSASRCRARRRSGSPKGLLPRAFSVVRRDRQTRSIPSSHSFLRVAPACCGQRWRCQSSQKSLPAESLSPRRARNKHPNVYETRQRLKGAELPHEMSYPTTEKLQYGVTPAQESTRVRPHVPLFLTLVLRARDRRFTGNPLTQFVTRLKYLPRAAPQRRHVPFSNAGRPPSDLSCSDLNLRPRQSARRTAGSNRLVIAMTKSATSHLLPVFARVDLAFERGEGCWLYATNGERYLDFTSGVAVNALGHAHPHLVAALQEQATKLWHMSNLFRSPDGERLAARLCEQSFADYVFFSNSGAEAMEGVIKLVRHYQFSKGHPER